MNDTPMETIEHNGEVFVSPPVLAARHGVTPHAVRNAIAEGILEARMVLGRWLIPIAAAENYAPRVRGGSQPGAGRPRKGKTGRKKEESHAKSSNE